MSETTKHRKNYPQPGEVRSKGMKKTQTKERTCLRCTVAFMSYGPQNRMCKICKYNAQDYCMSEIYSIAGV